MALLNILKKEKDIRKIFGERELKIIEKQLLGTALTQSEKNRLSRDIRPKFKVIESLSRFSEEFDIKKGEDTKKKIYEAVDIIKEDPSFKLIKKIVLFGSFVENKFTFRSDIDIAVIFNEINLNDATLFRKRISGKVSTKVDVQVYNVLPNKIKTEIDLKGKTLYEK